MTKNWGKNFFFLPIKDFGGQTEYDGRLQLLAIKRAEDSANFLFFRVDFGWKIWEIWIINIFKLQKNCLFSLFDGLCRPNGICKKTATKCNQTSVIFCEFSFLKILIWSRNTGFMNFDLYKIARESYFLPFVQFFRLNGWS